MRVVQALNALDRSDAVSNHALELDRALREAGHDTDIFSLHVHPELAARRRPLDELAADDGDLLLFHYAGFSPLGNVAAFRGRRGVVYHNVTPPEFFEEGSATHEYCLKGRRQLAGLPAVFDFGFGDSDYNVRELREVGLGNVQRLPIPWELGGLDATAPDPAVLARYSDGATNLLMVGRIARNKGHHFAVRALTAVRSELGRPVRLIFVGKPADGKYLAELRADVAARDLSNEIVFAGEVSTEALRAFYETAGALLVLSEHEGFCAPIVEAMHLDVPVVAARAAAVPETLGGGGMLLADRSPSMVAAAVAAMVEEGPAREGALERQRHRRQEFTRARTTATLLELLEWARSVDRGHRDALPRFSVVVCTCNRARVLGDCLEALRRLEYPDYEIVVVNGPSTDGTDEVLQRYRDIKRVSNPERNLSVSRNLGIAASAGEIVAFIDDDAVPERQWLRSLAVCYRDPRVGGAGGEVRHADGRSVQFRHGVISRYGRPDAVRDAPGDFLGPDVYNIVMGTNSSFRRTVLDEVGGFDENYEYYHDESDLCVRIIQAGYRIRHAENALVWHEFASSHIRRNPRDVDWRVVIKNGTYFYFRVNDWVRRPWDAMGALGTACLQAGMFTRWFLRGEMSLPLFLRSLGHWTAGVVLGYAKGIFRKARPWLARRRDPQGSRFAACGRPFVPRGGRSLHVALLSAQFAPDPCDGIGAYSTELARGLVERGHRVTVLTDGDRELVSWAVGARIHRLRGDSLPAGIPFGYRVTRRNVARALAIHRTVARLAAREGLDLVESPLWDAPGFALGLDRPVPLVLRLQTPMALAAKIQGWRRTDDLELAIRMEWRLLGLADAVIDPTGESLAMMRERFGVEPGTSVVRNVPYGVTCPADGRGPDPDDGQVRFLFVGRLEARKGIDVLMEAIPPVIAAVPGARFVVAGEAPDPDGLRRLRAGLEPRVARRVEFPGRVDDATRDTLYRNCDVFVAPSRYESFGLVYAEAMARAKPVVAGSEGGGAHVIVDGVTGRLVPPGDAGALVRALVDLGLDAEARARLGRAGRVRVEREFSVTRMVEDTLEVYEEIAADRRGERVAAARPRVETRS